MEMPTRFAELQAMSREKLVDLYDSNAPDVRLGLNFIREEIFRREAEESTARMLAMTRNIWWCTGIVTVATLVNTALFLLTLLRG